jgi:hypothetical protein
MGMIRKINLMGVPLYVEDLLFNIDRKKQIKRGCFTCREKGSVKTWETLQAKMNLQGHASTDPHHAHHGHQASALWQEVK